ncbi:Cof-type HAD-IIB family hydrolase [Paenibacillus sp. N1-5-1-14]|uniref:Cof-type HAD-IIB family hydrolase n=1 Tax=Paenibacillus radicibacter TaxID=2972488 RepID=UPI002158D375|nr:Cof-type HAD-IIB family hydrolase [Paenibacillus radicibacter]MCR8645298.1 Cof-type HAD-IIB family hydrolase [Paenibacillus radicibacter]
MSTTYKLVALDMDGTVLNEEKEVSARNRKAIANAIDAGVTVMFSTGRGVQSARPYIEELGLQAPIVSVNGSEVWKSPDVLHKRVLVPADTIRKLHAMALEYGSWYWAYAVEGLFNKDKWLDDVDSVEWLKFGFFEEDADKLAEIRRTVESWDLFEITNSHLSNIELNPKGISKGSGMIEVCQLLGITMDQVIAMGDSQNDLAMIRAAGLGVAMGNAQDEVKAAADLVTVTNDEDGVAAIIEEYVLGQKR